MTGETVGKSLHEQTKNIFEKIKKILRDGDFILNDVVVVRAYVTDLSSLQEFDQALKEFFFNTHPTYTLLGIESLVKSDLLIEIECIARR